jgi:hypothetical protein
MMGTEPEVLHLPAARSHAPLAAYQLGASATPDEARRFVAVVSADRTVMAALKCERRGFLSSDFVAKVVNDSDEELSCSLTAWTHHGSVPLAPSYFWIKPQSVAQVPIRVPLRLPHRMRTIALHMQNRTLRATAEADVPTPAAVRLATALATVAGAVLAAFIAWRSTIPAIAAYTLPSQVAAGDRVTAQYAYSGLGTAEYDVTSNGEHISGGVLSSRHGTFSFPTAKTAAFYHTTFAVVGPLGTVRRQLLVEAAPFGAQGTLAIDALQPDPSVVRSGEHISVRYIAQADSGRVTLYDATGIALQHAAYDASGLSTLTAPPVDIPTQYRVELDVTRGGKTASASAGLLVMPNDDAVDNAPVAGMLTPEQLLHVAPAVVSASSFAVRILQHPDQLTLTLESATGTPLLTQTISSDQSLVYFNAPNVSQDTPYVIVAQFSRGQAAQVLLTHVLVRVRQGGSAGP